MKKYNRLFWLLSMVMVLQSCVDRTFDEPDFQFTDPDIEVTTTIAVLKSGHINGQYETLSGDQVISGVVVANDKSGNFYETIVISDETGGIELQIDKRSLFNTYPVGRRVFVKTNGLVMGDYNELIQLGFASNDDAFIGIPGEYVDDFIFGGSLNNPIAQDTLQLKDIGEEYMSMLVTLKDVEFVAGELGYTFADGQYKVTTNRTLEDCFGRDIILRTSGYASFADAKLPGGKGTITAVLSRYRNDFQLYLRDTTDLVFNKERCGTGTGNEVKVDLIDLRNDYNNGQTSIGDELKIVGTVISDRTHNNIHGNNAVIQDETGGIVIRFASSHDLDLGDEVEVIVSGMELSDYNGLLQISNLALTVVTKFGNATVSPRVASIEEIRNNAENWESTLMKIEAASIVGGGSFSGNLDVTDGTGTIAMYTRSQASFADLTAPSGEVSIVAIVGDYNGVQINLRSADDVVGGTVDPGNALFEDDFESGLDKWTAFNVLGDQVWTHSSQYGNPGACAKMSGYDGSSFANEDWLISPSIDLTAYSSATLSFETAMNYSGNALEVFLISNYNGTSNPNDITSWEKITPTLSGGSWSWTPSGNIDLSGYLGGQINFAFKFTSNDQESSTWEIDNVKVVAE